ncbi:hypothetical protein LTS18_008132, partial [Coniosporium uncinatum]
MSSQVSEIVPEAFPARTRSVSGEVNGVHTDVTSIAFADKILFTISQGGRLAHWVHVPLDISSDPTALHANSTSYHNDDDDGDDGSAPTSDLLPMSHLTATTILGGTIPERETVGQLCATQIASAVATKDPDEKRMVVVALGLQDARMDQ